MPRGARAPGPQAALARWSGGRGWIVGDLRAARIDGGDVRALRVGVDRLVSKGATFVRGWATLEGGGVVRVCDEQFHATRAIVLNPGTEVTTTTIGVTTTTGTTTTTTPPPPGGGAPSTPPAEICGNHSILDGPSSPPAGAVTVTHAAPLI